jgi:cell division transport system permease protein
MRLSLVYHSIREGLRSLIRHPLGTLASVTTIALMLTLLSAFTVFSINARHIMAVAGQRPPVEITMEIAVSDDQLAALDQALTNHPAVLEFTRHTPEENYALFQKNMENKTLFEDFPVGNIPYTYTVRLTDPALGIDFQNKISGVPGVRKVSLELSVMQFLSKAIVWVNFATMATFLILSVISLFIISNMVRVAVFARGEEISIMKYVGATNWYILIPFILEGALVGLTGAFLAWISVWLIYGRLYVVLMPGTNPADILAMVTPNAISRQILLINILIGVGVGALGSAISVRRHIRV